METILILILVVAVCGLAAVLVFQSRRATPTPASVPALDPTAQQAQIQAALEQAFVGNRQMLESERARDHQELESKKSLIEARMAEVARVVEGATALMGELERDREAKFASLTTQLAAQQEQVVGLANQAQGLREALTSGKTRGQWGERMAEDQLRAMGFIAGVNYRKRTAIEQGIPDYSIFMPGALLLHVDVKFPLDNYLAYLDAADDLEQKRFSDAFLKDVRRHVKDLSDRGYHRGADSVDFTMLYVPVESVYAFVHEQEPKLVNDAHALGIVFCSPSTLHANLSLVRQAIESFNLQEATHEVVDLLARYVQQHELFDEEFQKIGRSIDTAKKDYDKLSGTRVNQIHKVAERIESLRRDRAELRSVESVSPDDQLRPALEA
jgi:DNA recombination protein RmuC